MTKHKRYVVQTQFEVQEFDYLDLAVAYARQSGFASLYSGQDVVEIQGSAVTLRNGFHTRAKIWEPQLAQFVIRVEACS